MISNMMTLIHYTWCLPQMLIAWIVRLFVKVHKKEKIGNVTYYYTNLKCGSASIGNKVFLCEAHWNSKFTKKHEYGHYLQNLILGWLTLFVINLPSLIWAGCFSKYRVKHRVSYYNFYTESWANKLGFKYCTLEVE